MTVDTQNHIRDTFTIVIGSLGGVDAFAATIQPIAAINHQVAAAWPFVIAAAPIGRALLGIGFRIYNTWYPPSQTATKGTPSNP